MPFRCEDVEPFCSICIGENLIVLNKIDGVSLNCFRDALLFYLWHQSQSVRLNASRRVSSSSSAMPVNSSTVFIEIVLYGLSHCVKGTDVINDVRLRQVRRVLPIGAYRVS